MRTSNGCWTCRVRRKKCDEKQSVCGICAALRITCSYDEERPAWMDGGVRQEEMAKQLKREIKEKGNRRGGERAIHISSNRVQISEAITSESTELPDRVPMVLATPPSNLFGAHPYNHNSGVESYPEASTILFQHGADRTNKDALESIVFEPSDTVLLMFYLEQLLPFLFPFYQPSLHQGGRAWMLELMMNSPVVRQATLCLSSFFFTLAQGAANRDGIGEMGLAQTRAAFAVLRQALQVIDSSGITEHPHCAVRIMASIMQIQRFEIAVSSFNSCQAHLDAALALFTQLVNISGTVNSVGSGSSFNTVMRSLGSSSWNLPAQHLQFPSAEQAAFRFSSALLILDDIIASTVLQEEPRLYEYHRNLLDNIDDTDPPLNLEVAIGCQNWTLLNIGEIAVLDAWKQRCKRAGNLDVMELVHRATAIKDSLEAHLKRLGNDPILVPRGDSGLLDVFIADHCRQSGTLAGQSSLATRVWAHAALAYLFVVVSGWQPSSVDVRYHVGRVVELLTHQLSPPALLRTMVWPFCVAGCLAESAQEAHLRGMVEVLQPPSVFGTVRKALEIMENVWRKRDAEDFANHDLATCFQSQGGLVLLV